MRRFIMFLMLLGDAALSVYIGALILVSGIENIAGGAKANPTDGWRILWGVVQTCFLAELATGVILVALGWIIFGIFRDSSGGRYRPFSPTMKSSGRWPGF